MRVSKVMEVGEKSMKSLNLQRSSRQSEGLGEQEASVQREARMKSL